MDANENNHYCQLTPGDSSRAPHLSPPVIGAQTMLLTNRGFRTYHDERNSSFLREEMHVSEELGKMSHYNLPPPRLLLPSQNIQAPYRLRYINKVNDPTYTTKPVRDNNGDPIRVEIYDSYNQSRVSPDCFLSSAKVRIIVLDADFWKNRVNWSRSEFVQNVLRGREGKESILIGRSLTIQLENGVGTFGSIVFNDNSSWTKCGFRLGVMVEGDGEEGYLNGQRVQEGVSEPFKVRDRRTEESKKPDLLKLTLGVKNIKKIGKDRASLLQKKNINTVEDFLKLYYNDETALREILGIKSGKQWDSMVEHVKQCADEFHAKCNVSNNSSQPRQVLGIKSESGKQWDSMVEHVKQCADEFHAKCNVSNNSSQPRQHVNVNVNVERENILTQNCMIIPQPMGKNSSVCTEVERCVASWGSSRPNPSEKDTIEAGMPTSTAYGEHIREMQNPLAGFPHDESELLFDTFYDNLDSIMDGSGGGGGNY